MCPLVCDCPESMLTVLSISLFVSDSSMFKVVCTYLQFANRNASLHTRKYIFRKIKQHMFAKCMSQTWCGRWFAPLYAELRYVLQLYLVLRCCRPLFFMTLMDVFNMYCSMFCFRFAYVLFFVSSLSKLPTESFRSTANTFIFCFLELALCGAHPHLCVVWICLPCCHPSLGPFGVDWRLP